MRGWYIKHPVDFERDRRMLQLRAIGGFAATGAFWAFVAELTKLPGYLYSQCDHSVITLGMSVTPQELTEWIEQFKKAGLLVANGDGFEFPDLKEWRREFDNKRHIALQRGKTRGVGAVQAHCDHSVTTVRAECGDNNSNSYSNYNSDPKEGGVGGEPPPVPPRNDPPERTIPTELERYRPYVQRYLPAPNPEQPAAWEHDTRWLNVGRKPLTRWPLLWLSDVELCQVFKIYEELVPDRAKRKKILEQAFAAAQADATTQLSAGKPLTTFNTFARITSWRLDEAIKTNISAERLEKLQGANGNLHQK